MAQAPRDQNRIPTLLGTSNADGITPIPVYADPVTHRLLVDSVGGGGGGSPGGSNTDIQFNDSGSFGGQNSFTFDKATNTVLLGLENDNSFIVTPNASTTNTDAGTLKIKGGIGNGTGAGGSVEMDGGLGGVNGNGGDVSLSAGAAQGSGVGGSVFLTPGTGVTGYEGNIVTGVNGLGTTSNGGFLVIGNMNGVPTGTPIYTGAVIYDYANNTLYVYNTHDAAWHTTGGGSGSPGSPTNSVQYNGAGSFSGSSQFLYNGTDTITLTDPSQFFIETSGDGISLNIDTSSGTTAGSTGGALDIVLGDGHTTGAGGLYSLITGNGGATGVGGSISLTAGGGGATSGAGGAVSITSGSGTNGDSAGGAVIIDAGNGHGNDVGGDLTFTGGNGGATGNGGNGTFTGGAGGATSGNGGTFEITGGNATTSGSGGTTYITGGNGAGASGDGGTVLITAGSKAGSGTAGVIKLKSQGATFGAILEPGNITASDKTFTFPNTSGTLALTGGTVALTVGTTTIASGTTTRILYDNAGVLGEYTLTGTGTVAVMATSPTFTTGATTPQLLATANDSGALGASGTAFSDLFLASGGVINWAAANVTLTQSSGILTQDHGEFRITSANVGTNADSVPTLSSTSTLTNKTLTSPTIQTSPVLAAATNLKFTVPTADPSATGITTNEFNSGYTSTAIGDLVYLDSSATWQKADADASAATYSSMLGIALSVAASGAAVNVLLQGFVYAATPFPTFTIGAPIFMSATAGAVTQTAPVTTDSATRVLGYGIHADKMYFNPSNDWVTHV